MARSDWHVESFHINVPKGDCAIHLLLQTNASHLQDIIHAAVLIDGGTISRKIPGLDAIAVTDASPIRRVINWINHGKRYTFPPGEQQSLSFDTIVMTHWDEDHYGGLIKTLSEDVADALKNDVPIPYLKWSDDDPPQPLTVFYCPNIKPQKGARSSKLNGLPSRLSRKKPEEGSTELIQYVIDKRRGKTYPLARLLYGDGKANDPNGKPVWNVLGVNFFNNHAVSATTQGQPMTPSGLLKFNPPNPTGPADGRPGMYCIGVMQETFQLPNVVEIVPSSNVTKTNRVSIAAAILWSDTTNIDNPPRCSHYFAGDLEDNFEAKVMTWLEKGGINQLTSMKLSHHGSHSSTPMNLVQKFSPANVVASNPRNGYFHPAWELIFVVSLWARLAEDILKIPHMWATKYPFYLSQDKNGNYTNVEVTKKSRVKVNQEAFIEGNSAFVTWIQDQYAGMLMMTDDRQTEYDEWLAAKDENKNLSGVIMNLVKARWDSYCSPGPSAMPATSSATLSPTLMRPTSAGLVEAVVIRSSDDPDFDGRIFFKIYNQPILVQQLRANSVHAIASTEVAKGTKRKEMELGSKQKPIKVPKKRRRNRGFARGGSIISNNLGADADTDSETDNELVNSSLSDAAAFDPGLGSNPDELDSDSGNAYAIPGPVMPVSRSSKSKTDVLVDPVAGLGSGTPWYIYSSVTQSSIIQSVTTDYSQTTTASAWDGIISTLHCSVVVLSQDPKSVTDGAPIVLDTSDEWAAWMSDCLGAKAFSLIKSGVAIDAGIGGFSFVTQLPPIDTKASAVLKASAIPVLLFTQDPAVLANTFAPATPPALGVRKGSTALYFGLDASKIPPGSSIKVSDLIAFTGLNELLDASFISLFIGPMMVNLPTSAAEANSLRNAVWFQPQAAYKTTTRLEFKLTDAAQSVLKTFLGDLGSFNINNAAIIARRSSIWSSGTTKVVVQSKGSLVLKAEFEFGKYDFTFDVSLELNQSSVVVELILRSPSSEIIKWLTTELGIPSNVFDFEKWFSQSAGPVQLAPFQFRKVKLEFDPDPITGKLKFSSLLLEMELKVTCNAQTLLFLVKYQYTAGIGGGSTLEADLWTAPIFNANDLNLRLAPDFENYAYFTPLTDPDWAGMGTMLDLTQLTGFSGMPKEIPTQVTQASLLIGSKGVAIKATVRANQGAQTGPVPVISIDEVDLALSYTFGSSNTSGFAASLEIRVLLQANPLADPLYSGPAQILGSIDYAPSGWTLTGSVTELWASTLYQFFNADIQDAVAPVLGHIFIDSIDVKYLYSSSGQVSQLDMSGNFHFGTIELDLAYNNKPSEDGKSSIWAFSAKADLETNKAKQTTLGEVLTSLIGTTGDLPAFVTGVQIEMAASTDSIQLNLQSLPNDTPGLFLRAAITISSFTFQYIQYSTTADAQAKKPPKRVFIASLDSLPTFDIPLIGKIGQPFDEALFMYVQPQDGMEGLTKADIDIIDKMLTQDQLPGLPYKPVKKDPQSTDVLIKSGMHFMLVLRTNTGGTNVVLDYCFGQSTPSPPQEDLQEVALADDAASSGKDPGMVSYSKTVNGLSIRNLGFGYSNNVLSVKLDATISLGPVAFELIGAAIKVDFGGGSLSNINISMVSFGIDGLAATFDRPPLLLAGMFARINNGTTKGYQGAVSIAFQPWMFAAAGFYGTQTEEGNSYTTAFVYAILNGPLITLEFAQIMGVTGGFGYNTNLKLPTAAAIPSFPFITSGSTGASVGDSVGSASNPVADLEKLIGTGWFFPKEKCFWVAAGLTISAFELLSVQAVIVVEWDPNVKLGVYGLASADIPSAVGGSGTTFARVQMGLAATVDFGAGTMKIDGQLTPASFILDPKCHLVGGFALYSWFGDAEPTMKGDFVFTIGGYHQAFVAPPQYPKPPRLGITWQFNDNIAIRGLAYFAITPKVCMGGGRLDVTLSMGSLYAFLDAYVDFLINFKPFHFVADGGISVGVKYTLDLWLVTLHISVEIACTLHIEGPPIHGTVHVNFWVFGFDINFGHNSDAFVKLTLDQFIELVSSLSEPLQAAVATITSQTRIKGAEDEPAPTPVTNGKLHVFSVTNGLIPPLGGESSSQPSGDLWLVRAATFSFMVACKFATDNIIIQGDDSSNKTLVKGSGNALHAKPMEENNVTSTVTVTITADLPPMHPDRKLTTHADLAGIGPVWNHDTGIFKNLPNGLWGTYNPATDPSYNPNDRALLNGTTGGSVTLLTGITITRPSNVLSTEDKTQPYSYTIMSVEEAYDGRFPTPIPMPASFQPAQPIPTSPSDNQWDAVASKWTTPLTPPTKPGQSFAVEFVDLWAQIGTAMLGWDGEKVAGERGADGALTGRPPEVLIEGIEKYLLWAPCLTQPVGVAA